MRTLRTLLSITVVLSATVVQLCAAVPGHAWLSAGTSGACTRADPCGSLASAITAAHAGGEVSALDSGDFATGATLTISSSITVDGSGVDLELIPGAHTAILINAGDTDTVVLRGIHLNGTGNSSGDPFMGIRFISGGLLVIEDCDIENFALRAISVESATDGARVIISNSTIHGGLNNGIVVQPPADTKNVVVLDNVRVVNNAHVGVNTNAGGVMQIRDSLISNNGTWGLLVTGAPVSVDNSSLANNGTGIEADTGGVVRLSNVNVWQNTVGLATSSGTINSFGNNQLIGNVDDGVTPTPKSLQ